MSSPTPEQIRHDAKRALDALPANMGALRRAAVYGSMLANLCMQHMRETRRPPNKEEMTLFVQTAVAIALHSEDVEVTWSLE